MKKFYSFMMLVVLTLFSSNAFAEAGDVTVNADIDFSNDPSKGILLGEVNQITLGGSTYISGETRALRTVDETNTVVIPAEQYAGRKDVVTISFDKAWGNKKDMGSGFRIVDSEGEYIATFQHARWADKSKNENTLNIDLGGLVGAQTGNAPILDRYTHFEISIDYKQKLITTVVTCMNPSATKTFTASLTSTNPVAKFEHFAYGVGSNTDRADSFDNLKITTTEGDYNVPTANYTVKYVCDGEEIKEADVRTSDVGDPITLLDADKVKFKSEDGSKKYEYVSDDSEGATIAADGSSVVTITFQEIPTFEYSVKAAIGDEEEVMLAEGTLFDDETTTVYWSKYVKGSDGRWYESTTAEYGMEISSMDQNYVADYMPCDISYFYEIEQMKTSKSAATSAGGTGYSNGASLGHAASARFYSEEAIEGGKYKVTIVGKARRSGGEDMGISYLSGGTPNPTGATITWSNTGTEDIEKVLEDVSIPACDGIAIVNNGNWNSTSYLDFIVLEKTGELDSYTVTVNEAENGSVSADVTEAKFGDKVTLTVEPTEGYAAKEVKATYIKTTVTPATEEGGEDVVTNEEIDGPVADDYTFTMPQANVTVSATFEKAYAIEIVAENGTVTSAPAEQGFEGDKVTLTITPATGYDFKSVSAVDAAGNPVTIADDNTFTMPASAVTVTAEFEEKVIMLETDMTSAFTALTEASNWTNYDGLSAVYTGTWACPEVEVNGIGKKQVCEYYQGTCNYTGDVLYQTVTGLAPGTYKIELYGGAAFTFDRGFGSTAFTGDFSVDKSTVYGGEDGKQGGAKIEPTTENPTGVSLTATTSVSTYGGEIPIYYAQTFPEGAAVVTLEGVEVGDNGEVKLAMSKTSTSTNWHVIQLKGVTATVNAKDALAAAVARAEAAASQDIPQAVADEVNQTIADNNKLYDTAEEYEAAIAALDAATAKANKYAAASEYFKKMADVLDKTNVYTQEAYDSYYGTWKQAYDEGTLDEATMATLTGNKAYIRNDWGAAHNGTDYYLDNVLLSAWTIGGEQCADYTKGMYINTWSTEGNDGSFENPFFEYWTGDGNSLGATNIQATMTGLEAGKAYTATVLARVYDTGTTPAEEGITLTVGDGDGLDVTNGETTVVGNAANNYTFHIGTFTATGNADDEGNLKITFNVGNGSNVSWFSFRDMMVEAVPATYEIVTQAENGTVEADATEATEGTTIAVTLTPDEGYELDDFAVSTFTWTTDEETGEKEMELGDEIEVTETETGYTFTMPAANVTAIALFKEAKTKNEPGTYKNTPLAHDMFKGWDGFDDYAKVNNENPYWDAPDLPADLGAGKTVYGSGNVANTDYADVTGAETLRITGTPGMQFRVLMNRQADNSLIELNPVVGEEGYVDVDLTPYEYVHINAIKTGWGSPEGTVESLILNPYDPTNYVVESYCGSSYEGIPVEVDLDAIYELIGAVPPSIKVVAEYPDGTRAENVRGTTDGWRDEEGNAKVWSGDIAQAPDFFLQDDSEDSKIFYMGGYPGKTEDPIEYTGTLVFINTITNAEQKVNFTLKYIPVPPVERNIVATILKTVEYTEGEGNYTKKVVELTEDEIAQITEALGIKTLTDDALEIYGWNPSDASFVSNWVPFDGWRNADGDFANWTGDTTAPVSVKIQENENLSIADGKFFTYNINGSLNTVQTYWAYANEEDAVLVEIDVIFPIGYPIIIDEVEHGTVTANKYESPAGETITLTVTPETRYKLESIKAVEQRPEAKAIGGMASANGDEVPLTEGTDADGNTIFTFTMPDAAVLVTPVFSVSTGINTLNGTDFATNLNEALRNGKVFDVSGRKVSNVVKGGIYIVDGKKMVIRK